MKTHRNESLVVLLLAAALLSSHPGVMAQESPASLKVEHFDRDPGWEGHNNRIVPSVLRTVSQDFGYSPDTHFAGVSRGEIGGKVWRSTTPAFYADKIFPRTLKQNLTASGTFAFTATAGSSGAFFGWFNARQRGGSRPVSSLGLDFDGEGRGARLAVRLITASNRSCGTFVTPFIPGKFRPTPIRNDGTPYTWTLTYDPEANAHKGRFQFTIRSNRDQHEEFEGKTFAVDLPEGFQAEDMTFDRFGMMNMGKPGKAVTVYFTDIRENGRVYDFSTDPNWQGSGNRVTFQDPEQTGAQNFGFSPTSHAGGQPGEIGGAFWRTEKDFGYYADRVGPLTLSNRLEASGRVMLAVGAPDSAACIGWFNSDLKDERPDKANLLGVTITGPTRVGHYFAPAYATATGDKGKVKSGPVLVPGNPHNWSLVYDPAANGGKGAVQVSLDGQTVTLDLKPEAKAQGARFDRFGLFSTGPGGSLVRIYFDDLKYSTHP